MSNIYDKIQKLLSMANGSVQGNEADVALKMANDLMEENNITMADLDAASKDKELGSLGQWNKGDKAYKVWEKTLAGAMAKLFDCHVIYRQAGGKSSMLFIGREGNVKTSWIMYDWIHDKLWSDAKKKCGGRYNASFCVSYCSGAAGTIYARVCEMKHDVEVKNSEAGIIVADESGQYMRQLYPHLINKSRRTSVSDSRGYSAGARDGQNIGLNRQFGLRAIAG